MLRMIYSAPQTSGKAVDKAALTDGKLYGIRVPDFPVTAQRVSANDSYRWQIRAVQV